MKLSDFVKKEPGRARYLILALSVALFTCFSALAAVGVIVNYSHVRLADTNAVLLASDLLSLQNAIRLDNGTEVRVFTALLRARMSNCLNNENVQFLDGLLASPDERLSSLCFKIEEMTKNGTVSSADLELAVSSLSQAHDTDNSNTASDAEIAQIQNRRLDPVELAEAQFGVKGVFHSDGHGAYCKNIYADFESRDRVLRLYAGAGIPENILVSKTDAVRRATKYAAKQYPTKCEVLSVAERYGVWWIELAENNKTVKIGVRGDTGNICFYLLTEK